MKNRRGYLLFLFYLASISFAWSQNVDGAGTKGQNQKDTLNDLSATVQTLDEVIIKGARVKHYTDRDVYFPTT
ncbi:hypothetical protein [uncultured Bacteroides sp.]|uniref:hypothetical protein n=1 Tax=uncultured Bacteroides sp. TaxID=162156 RepID=UPI00262E5B73|nr:hypothetical protein [uncultured Bacteroides sp.]